MFSILRSGVFPSGKTAWTLRLCSGVILSAGLMGSTEASQDAVNVSQALSQQMTLTEKLERGEVFTSRMGTSFVIQALIKQESAKIQEAMNKDLGIVAQLIPDLGAAMPFKGSNNQKYLYLKARGIGGGAGILTEVVEGFDEAFVQAPLLPTRGSPKKAKPSGVAILNPWEHKIAAEFEELDKTSSFTRRIDFGNSVRIVGPLHEVISLQGLSLDIQFSFKPYHVEPKPDFANQVQIGGATQQIPSGQANLRAADESKKSDGEAEEPDPAKSFTLFTVQVSFVPVMPKHSLGDFRGFGEKKLVTAQYAAQKFVSRLRENLERLN